MNKAVLVLQGICSMQWFQTLWEVSIWTIGGGDVRSFIVQKSLYEFNG